MNLNNIQTLTHATERDIDLLLVEEFRCNPRFTRQFVAILSKSLSSALNYDSNTVLHSKRRIYNRREIDICLELTTNSDKSYILIENKLDTTEQEGQGESYREECEILRQEKNAKYAFSVLVCPSGYCNINCVFAAKFHTVITYEQIRELLQTLANQTNDAELASRLLYRADLIQQAITKQRRGYEPVVRVEIGGFNKKYVELCREKCPEMKPGVSMLKLGNPSESKTIIFDPKILPVADYLPQMRLVHQLREGNANINFYGWGNYFEKIALIIQQDLRDTPFKVSATINRRKGGNSGLMLYVETPRIDNLESFEVQQEGILKGIYQADTLRQWCLANKTFLQKWSELVSAERRENAV